METILFASHISYIQAARYMRCTPQLVFQCYVLLRFVAFRCVSCRFVSYPFRSVAFPFVSFRYGSFKPIAFPFLPFPFVPFRSVSFRFVPSCFGSVRLVCFVSFWLVSWCVLQFRLPSCVRGTLRCFRSVPSRHSVPFRSDSLYRYRFGSFRIVPFHSVSVRSVPSRSVFHSIPSRFVSKQQPVRK